MTPSLDLLHALVCDNGKRWGAIATDWQREDARAVLAPKRNEPRRHWLGRPKGGSKSTDLAGMVIAWLATEAQPLAEGFAMSAVRPPTIQEVGAVIVAFLEASRKRPRDLAAVRRLMTEECAQLSWLRWLGFMETMDDPRWGLRARVTESEIPGQFEVMLVYDAPSLVEGEGLTYTVEFENVRGKWLIAGVKEIREACG